jgi:hypothetical protein
MKTDPTYWIQTLLVMNNERIVSVISSVFDLEYISGTRRDKAKRLVYEHRHVTSRHIHPALSQLAISETDRHVNQLVTSV